MYDFDTRLDRTGFSQKWDKPNFSVPEGVSLIPMWIADMDFASPAFVLDTLRRRLDHPTFGYFSVPQRFTDAILNWRKGRFGDSELTADCIHDENSTVGAVVSTILLSTQPGDGVLVHTPNYNGFTYAIEKAGRKLVGSPMFRDAAGVWRIDFADMEKRIVDEKIRCFILCSPHNPTGRVWEREELLQVAALCEKHNVMIVADEIWSDFVFAPAKQTTFATLTPYTRSHTVSAYGPSKTFNLAGLRCAYSIIYDSALREVYQKYSGMTHYNVPNTFTIEAVTAAYEQGADYVAQLLAYIRANMEHADAYIKKNLPCLESCLPEGTYTMWVRFVNTGRTDRENAQRMANEGLLVNPSSDYNGTDYFRMNLACPRAQLDEALAALSRAMA